MGLDGVSGSRADRVLRCPICGEAFTGDRRGVVCSRGHAFDRAREGYVNLLRSKRTGDSKEMLLARRAFLDAGYYRPVQDLLCRSVLAYAPPQPAEEDGRYLLDAGCGEGSYLASVAQALAAQEQAAVWTFLALDVAKEAVRLAVRRTPGAIGLVADIHADLPLAGHSLHVLLNIFAPRRSAEFARILAPGGLLLVVIPAPDHLQELRGTLGLLGMEEHKEARVRAVLDPSFALVDRVPLRFRIEPPLEHLQALLTMTPSYRHPGRRTGSVEAVAGHPVRCSFLLLAYRR